MIERDIQNAKYIVSVDLKFVEGMFEAWAAVSNAAEKDCALQQFSLMLERAHTETGTPRTVCLGIALAILDNIRKENLQISKDEIQ
jgi:hypothetical protein